MSSGGNSTNIRQDELTSKIKLYQGIIFGTPVLFASMLLLLFCLLYTRRQRSASIRSQIRGQQFTVQGFMDSPDVIHGLTKSFREMLPIINFDAKFAAMSEQTQCTVCLGDYQLNEKLLQLPTCGHSFHVECIDEWLSKNVTCPICRTSLLLDEDGNTSECSVVVNDAAHRRDDNLETSDSRRMWEERVMNQIQEQFSFPRINESSGLGPSSSSQPSGNGYSERGAEVSISLERS